MQLPTWFRENDFTGVVDLAEMQAYMREFANWWFWRQHDTTEIPDDLMTSAQEYTKLCSCHSWTFSRTATVREHIRASGKSPSPSEAFPIFAAPLFKDKGVQPMLIALSIPAVSLKMPATGGYISLAMSLSRSTAPVKSDPFAVIQDFTHPFYPLACALPTRPAGRLRCLTPPAVKKWNVSARSSQMHAR